MPDGVSRMPGRQGLLAGEERTWLDERRMHPRRRRTARPVIYMGKVDHVIEAGGALMRRRRPYKPQLHAAAAPPSGGGGGAGRAQVLAGLNHARGHAGLGDLAPGPRFVGLLVAHLAVDLQYAVVVAEHMVHDRTAANEVDLRVLARNGLHMIELNHLARHDRRARHDLVHNAKPVENPLLLATRKAKRLRSLLERVARNKASNAQVPFVRAWSSCTHRTSPWHSTQRGVPASMPSTVRDRARLGAPRPGTVRHLAVLAKRS